MQPKAKALGLNTHLLPNVDILLAARQRYLTKYEQKDQEAYPFVYNYSFMTSYIEICSSIKLFIEGRGSPRLGWQMKNYVARQ